MQVDLGKYLILDLECGTEAAFKRKSNPFIKDADGQYLNGLYYIGYRRYDEERNSAVYTLECGGLPRRFPSGLLDGIEVLVGFNICGYDLHYLWEDPQLIEFFKRGGRVHDCQYAEYLLRAQHQKYQMCSLNDVAPLYGGEAKVDAVAEMWKQGIKTYQIPADLMLEYLIGHDKQGGDIGNTLKVYTGQVEKLHKLGMYKAWLLRMDGMLCTSRMQFTGIKVDTKKAEVLLAELEEELQEITEKLNEFLPPDLPEQIEWTWSNRQKSAILFGGALHYQKRGPILDDDGNQAYTKATEDRYLWNGRVVPPELLVADGKFQSKAGQVYECDKFLSGKKKGMYKTKKVEVQGKPKTKLYDELFHLPRLVEPDPDWATKTADRAGNVVYSSGDEQMEVLQHSGIPFCQHLSRYAALLKEIGTYYRRVKEDGTEVGMLTLVDQNDSILHHMLNHTLTVTTRLSSSNPNMQNLPRKDKSKVKQMFVSRYGEDGVMIEADYSQLEVVGQGVLSNDLHLRNDLKTGVDFHCKRVAARFGISYDDAVIMCKNEEHPDYKLWKGRRTECKVFSFQRAYGAGATKISATTGISKEAVEAMIEAEDRLYPGVVEFNKQVQRAVESTAKPFFDPVLGSVFRRGYWQAPTGTLYGFRTYPAPKWMQREGIKDSFMPTELKNYPVQGTSGEFVQAVLGKLIREFIKRGFFDGLAELVNTVHDCIWIDCHKSVLHDVVQVVKPIMESVPEIFNSTFDMQIDVPFPVEVEIGPDMYNLTHYKAEHV